MSGRDHIITSIECAMVCVGVKDRRTKLVCFNEHEQKQIARDLSYGIMDAVLDIEGRCLWVDSGDHGLELILYERAKDAVRAAEQIANKAKVRSADGDLELQVAVHWGEVVLDNTNLKVFGPSIQDVKKLQSESTSDTPNVSQATVDAAAQERACGDLSNRCWVFISYSHDDNKRPNFVEELLQQTRPFEAEGKLGVFVDTRIRPGDDWFKTIMFNLANHRVAVLLVGPGFFASDFIRSQELPYIEQAYLRKGLKVLWVLLMETAYLDKTWLKDVQAAHDRSKPIRQRGKMERNGIWADVVTQITEPSNRSFV